ncbi:MAG: hypothetical protein RLY86_502 [Pseudomonadota bacterium]|jgi:DNA-binding MarR family transcriptional regulator
MRDKGIGDAGVGAAADRQSGVLDQGGLPDLLGYQLRRAQTGLFAHFAAWFREDDLTPGQLGLLVLVGRNPGLSQAALAKELGVERATLGEALVPLAGRGLIRRDPSPTDRRSIALSLSAEGRELVNRLLAAVPAHEADFAKALTPAEQARLLHLLRKLNGA